MRKVASFISLSLKKLGRYLGILGVMIRCVTSFCTALILSRKWKRECIADSFRLTVLVVVPVSSL